MTLTPISTVHLILLLVFFSTSCIAKKDKPKIDDEIVLKMGSFELTRYEYEKNAKKEVANQRYKNVEEWSNDYIINSYFLADAYYRKYDTISAIYKKVNYASISMLCQYKGYLWDKLEEPKLVFLEKEIKRIYRKQNKLFDLEYFLFPDIRTFNMILHKDTCIQTETDFNKVRDNCHTNSVKYLNRELVYPFYELEPVKDQIYTLKQGSVIRIPLKNGKILLAHLKSIKKINQKRFKEEKDNIYANLKHLREGQIIEDKQYIIFNKANIVIDKQVVEMVLRKLKNDLPLKASKTFLADTVLKYLFNTKPNTLLVEDFLDYYYNNPFMLVIDDIESLNNVLRAFVEEKYLYEESVNLDITKERKFILYQRDYMNRLILNTYYQNNFGVIKVSIKEMNDYYNANKQSLSQCKMCYVSVFNFKDRNSAYFNLNLINKIISQNGIKNPSDSSMIGLLSYRLNDIIESKNKKYPATIIRNIFNSKMNTPIGPLELDNQTIILIKTKEEGQEIPPFDLAKERIEKELIREKLEILKDKKISELISKHPIIINKIQKK
ncbi:MAG: hypothetical protein WCS03_08035 [Bacteroidota bacterium]